MGKRVEWVVEQQKKGVSVRLRCEKIGKVNGKKGRVLGEGGGRVVRINIDI